MTGRRNRVPCLVPGCTLFRTMQAPREWICHEHWLALPQDTRKGLTAAKRARRCSRDPISQTHPIWAAIRKAAIALGGNQR